MHDHSQKPSPRRLLILRHAKSSWSEPGMADFDRPLNDRGRSAASKIGRKMHHEKLSVDVVLASTATRVRETLDRLLPAWRWHGPIVWEKRLYLASPETIIDQLAALDDAWHDVLVVGHNPGLSELVAYLTEEYVDMPTAGLIILTGIDADWGTALRSRPWHQQAYWKPKEL